mgnify:CR=1 FL=1
MLFFLTAIDTDHLCDDLLFLSDTVDGILSLFFSTNLGIINIIFQV